MKKTTKKKTFFFLCFFHDDSDGAKNDGVFDVLQNHSHGILHCFHSSRLILGTLCGVLVVHLVHDNFASPCAVAVVDAFEVEDRGEGQTACLVLKKIVSMWAQTGEDEVGIQVRTESLLLENVEHLKNHVMKTQMTKEKAG
jgi:hypothetical protein